MASRPPTATMTATSMPAVTQPYRCCFWFRRIRPITSSLHGKYDLNQTASTRARFHHSTWLHCV